MVHTTVDVRSHWGGKRQGLTVRWHLSHSREGAEAAPTAGKSKLFSLFQHIGSACCVIASHMWVGEYLGWCVDL